MDILNLITEAVLTGIFGVIGGIIPLGLTLYLTFLWSRSNFKKVIKSEKKLIQAYKDSLTTNQEGLNNFNTQISAGRVNVDDNIIEAISTLQGAIIRDNGEIIRLEAWVERIENATFPNWVAYYYSKSYFSEYFKR